MLGLASVIGCYYLLFLVGGDRLTLVSILCSLSLSLSPFSSPCTSVPEPGRATKVKKTCELDARGGEASPMRATAKRLMNSVEHCNP